MSENEKKEKELKQTQLEKVIGGVSGGAVSMDPGYQTVPMPGGNGQILGQPGGGQSGGGYPYGIQYQIRSIK